jgi:hypothetical protein
MELIVDKSDKPSGKKSRPFPSTSLPINYLLIISRRLAVGSEQLRSDLH